MISRKFFAWFEKTCITSKKMKTFNQFHVKMFEFHFMCLLENCNFSTSVVKNTISRQFEVLYFFRNFREISRKMGQNLSHFAKNQKRKTGTTLLTTINYVVQQSGFLNNCNLKKFIKDEQF